MEKINIPEKSKYNWTQINSCPDLITDRWDFALAISATFVFVLGILLVNRYKAHFKSLLFILVIVIINVTNCLLYEYRSFLKSVAIYFRCDTLMTIRNSIFLPVSYFGEFEANLFYFLVFCIFVELFLSTCLSHTRHTFRCFTEYNSKRILLGVLVAVAIVVAFVTNQSAELKNLCKDDTNYTGNEILAFIHAWVFFLVDLTLWVLFYVLAFITWCRISRVGTGTSALSQEETDTEGADPKSPLLMQKRVKRSVFYMMLVVFTIFPRALLVQDNSDTNLESMMMRTFNVLIAAIRLHFYHRMCRHFRNQFI